MSITQLVNYGAQDIHLTGSHRITYFRINCNRHTNFAIDPIITTETYYIIKLTNSGMFRIKKVKRKIPNIFYKPNKINLQNIIDTYISDKDNLIFLMDDPTDLLEDYLNNL
uniref:Uncharacterized protein n=1 Tax=viral metagenome TaxID=1070528 RepID=A0A6C0E5V2_9ZZZZ